jgi:GAF domain-containing protein
VTDLGRVRDVQDFSGLLARVADLLDASGLIVWMGNTAGADLRPVLAHGYTPRVLARIPPVPRLANNAAAAAYRSGLLQIVLASPGGAAGAVVAPIISVDGCIGALSAEIRGGAETSESLQALAAILAAQLANVVAPEPEADAGRAAATS